MSRNNRIASLLGTAALAAALVGCGSGDAQQHLRSAVDAKGKKLTSCYEDALQRNRSAQGTMKLFVFVEQQSGKVDKVEVQSSEIDDPQLQGCVKDTLTTITLPKTPKAGMKVDYTLRFTHAGTGGEVPAAGGAGEPAPGEEPAEDETEGGAGAGGGFELNVGGN